MLPIIDCLKGHKTCGVLCRCVPLPCFPMAHERLCSKPLCSPNLSPASTENLTQPTQNVMQRGRDIGWEPWASPRSPTTQGSFPE